MSNREILEEAIVRIEKIIWVENEIANFDSPSDTFEEFCEDLEFSEKDSIVNNLPFLLDIKYPDPEELLEEFFYNKLISGFIFQAAHPVMDWRDNDSASFSWGYYNTAWLYAESLDQMAEVAANWAKKIDDEKKKKLIA